MKLLALLMAGLVMNLLTVSAQQQDELLDSVKTIKVVPEEDGINEPDDEVHTYVEDVAEFPGGIDKFYEFLRENINYSKEARKAGIEGRVIVQFIIDKEGNVVDPKVLKGVNEELNAEALRVIRLMPKWIPARIEGKPVNLRTSIPIVFKLR